MEAIESSGVADSDERSSEEGDGSMDSSGHRSVLHSGLKCFEKRVLRQVNRVR